MEIVIEVHTEERAAAQLAAVLELVGAGQITCSAKTRRPSAASIRLLASSLPFGDFYPDEPISSFAWPLILQAGGLADGPRLRLTPRGTAAARKHPAEVLPGLWQRWARGGIIDEFIRIEAVRGQRSANVLSAVRRRRETVAAALTLLPAGEWTDVDYLFRLMQRERLHPSVHRTELALWKLYLEDPQYGSLGYDGAHIWSVLEGRYTLAVLFEYAATLGLLDVRYTDPQGARSDYRELRGGEGLDSLSRYDGLSEVRLTGLGGSLAAM